MPDNWIGRILVTGEELVRKPDFSKVASFIPCNQGEGVIVDASIYPKLSAKLTQPPADMNLSLGTTMNPSGTGYQYFGGTGEGSKVTPRGSHLLISAYYTEESGGSFGWYRGRVYLYTRQSDATYLETWHLKPTEIGANTTNARLGVSVAFDDTASVIIASAGTDTANNYEGVVYVVDSAKNLLQTIKHPTGLTDHRFGTRVYLSGDGKTLVIIGLTHLATPVVTSPIYIYKHNETEFELTQTIDFSGAPGNRYASVSQDGNTIVIGDDDDTVAVKLGVWNGSQYVISDITSTETYTTPVISADGQTVVAKSNYTFNTYAVANGVATNISTLPSNESLQVYRAKVSPSGEFLTVFTEDNSIFCHTWADGDWRFDQKLTGAAGVTWGYPEVTDLGEAVIVASRHETSTGIAYFYNNGSIDNAFLPNIANLPGVSTPYKIMADPDYREYSNEGLGSASYEIRPRVQTITLTSQQWSTVSQDEGLGSASYEIRPRVQTITLTSQQWNTVSEDEDLGSASYEIRPRVQTITLTRI